MSFIDEYSEGSFFSYLSEQLHLDESLLPQANDFSRLGNTIGATALRLNLLTPEQVDELVKMQGSQGGYFGELAIKAGFLTPTQVGQLLEIQSVHDDLFLAEQLILDGKVDFSTLLHGLANYLAETESKTATM